MVINDKKIPLPGLRNIKTALSVLILLVIYQLTGRENEFIAITSAFICLQDSVSKTLQEGRDRVIGTIIGGAYGIAFVFFELNKNIITKDIGIFLSCILIIYICNLLAQSDLISNTVFVFILVVSVPATEMLPMAYAINRIIDTLVGIIVAVLVNRYFFPPKIQRVSYKRHLGTVDQLKKDSKFVKVENCKQSTWIGGDALELLIYPKNSLYEEYDFKYRISVADTIGELDLSYTPNYYRRTMILKGETTFEHIGYHTIHLKQFDQDYFKGNIKTKSKGTTTNFNIMLAKGYESDIATIKNKETTDLLAITADDLDIFEVAHYYSLYDNNVMNIIKDDLVVFTQVLNKGDNITFKHLHHYKVDEFNVTISNEDVEDNEIICIRANIK